MILGVSLTSAEVYVNRGGLVYNVDAFDTPDYNILRLGGGGLLGSGLVGSNIVRSAYPAYPAYPSFPASVPRYHPTAFPGHGASTVNWLVDLATPVTVTSPGHCDVTRSL
ncbi:hypothetical protein BaRGS_00014084 [Batillaria attramentaria]|uniref:Uncharacterized protein n=1 Tax=Batillaria attramentaria TaxID=370345 RepID=A0ABD0L5U6_9CAEN